jgi:hypothetical protein
MLKGSSSHMRSSRNSQRPKWESKAEEKNRCEISSRRRQESLVVKGWTKKKSGAGVGWEEKLWRDRMACILCQPQETIR